MNRAVAALAMLVAVCHPAAARAEDGALTKTASIVVHVHASADAAFPLFDPVNETKWDPEWKPRLLGDRVDEGLVFVVGDGDGKSTWLIDRYDVSTRSIGYVVVGKSLLTRIAIHVAPAGTQSTATVTYTRTALDDDGRNAVERFAAHFPTQAPHWEGAINGYLASVAR